MKRGMALGLVIVGVAYACASFLLYRARVQSENHIWDSDALVFYGPALVTLLVNGFLVWRSYADRPSRMTRLGAAIGLAVLATFLATWCWAFVAFNLYGT